MHLSPLRYRLNKRLQQFYLCVLCVSVVVFLIIYEIARISQFSG